MSTKELQKRLAELGRSTKGQRSDLVRRYEKYKAQEVEEETDPEAEMEETAAASRPHASDRPMMVMVDESTGNKYMRSVDRKGLGPDGDNSWLVKDMHQELKSWGHPGGMGNQLILKSDGEPAIVAVREALSRLHGGRVTPEQPPRGEHQANGLAEVTGRHIRDQARVLKLYLQNRVGRKVLEDEAIMPWL